MDNANEVCYQVASVNMCKWFYQENHARKWFLWEKARPNSGVVCVKIVSYADGGEERTPHHFAD